MLEHLGKRCYLVVNRYYNGDNVVNITNIGSVFIEPAFPKDIERDNNYLGFVERRQSINHYSVYFNGIYFVFPMLEIPKTITKSFNPNPIQPNYIKLNTVKPEKASRYLIEKKKISNTIIDSNTIRIDDLHNIDLARKYIENMEQSNGGTFIKKIIKPRRKNQFPEADFRID